MRIAITGDIVYNSPITELCEKGNGHDFLQIFQPAISHIQNCDYLIVNPESCFSGESFGYTSARYSFNTPVKALEDLKSMGVGLVTLANNHCMDRGYEGILATAENCEKVGMDYIGISAGERNAVKIKDFGNKKIAFVNATYGTNAFAHGNFLPEDKKLTAVAMIQPEEDLEGAMHLLESNAAIEAEKNALYKNGNSHAAPHLEAVKKDIEFAKANSDFVIMLLHSGGQYNPEPDAYTLFVCGEIKKMGADMIVTNHPHIILHSEFDENGIFTAYCLGNLLYARPYDRAVSTVNHEYSALLYIDFDEGVKYPKLSFSVMRHISVEGKVPKVYNAYDYYKITGDTQTHDNLIAFANRFMPGMGYSQPRAEYEITKK